MPRSHRCAQCHEPIHPRDRHAGKVSHVDSNVTLSFCGSHYNTDEARAIVQARFESAMNARRESSPKTRKTAATPSFDKAAVDARSRERGVQRSREVRRAG